MTQQDTSEHGTPASQKQHVVVLKDGIQLCERHYTEEFPKRTMPEFGIILDFCDKCYDEARVGLYQDDDESGGHVWKRSLTSVKAVQANLAERERIRLETLESKRDEDRNDIASRGGNVLSVPHYINIDWEPLVEGKRPHIGIRTCTKCNFTYQQYYCRTCDIEPPTCTWCHNKHVHGGKERPEKSWGNKIMALTHWRYEIGPRFSTGDGEFYLTTDLTMTCTRCGAKKIPAPNEKQIRIINELATGKYSVEELAKILNRSNSQVYRYKKWACPKCGQDVFPNSMERWVLYFYRQNYLSFEQMPIFYKLDTGKDDLTAEKAEAIKKIFGGRRLPRNLEHSNFDDYENLAGMSQGRDPFGTAKGHVVNKTIDDIDSSEY